MTDFKSDLALADVVFPDASDRRGIYRNGAKRAIETLLVLLTSPVTLPLILFLALLVACDGGNPFFAQKRLGRNGRVFRILKLRSMVVDAERRLEAHLDENPEARAQWNSTQKLKQDPRVTLVGRFLRKTSMDELPQLLNVLNGTMSLVGPRPMMVDQRVMYYGQSYYRLRPGITGLWQISARNESEFVARVRYDEEYHRDLSGWLDMKILVRTVVVVLRGTGY
ncbi:sugar transferase [Paracoccus angustae]